MVFIPAEFIPEYRAARKHSLFSPRGWWLNRWPLLGWMETFVKIAAWCFVPYVTLDNQNANMANVDVRHMSPSFAVETLIMLIASALLAAAIIDRLIYRELISIMFVFPNNWAHWTVTMAMLRHGRSGVSSRYLRIFCFLMFAGDIIKLLFFTFHDFSLLSVARYVLYALVAVFALMYGTILALEYGYVQPPPTIDQVSMTLLSFLRKYT